MHSLFKFLLTTVAALPLATLAQGAFSQRTVTLVVPLVAGGSSDSIARDVARNMADRLGQPVIVENRGGAGGAIGADIVAKTNGCTLLFATSTFATNAAFEPKLPYDPLKDFAPVAMMGRGPPLVVASRQPGVTTVTQLIAAAKAHAGGLN